MLASQPLVAFVGVSDLARSKAFYSDVLGLRLRDESPFALVAESGGATLRITAVGHAVPPQYTALGWLVDDLAAMVDRLVAGGVDFVRFEGMQQDERGIWSTPDGSRVAWFRDPDGNTLSLTQPAGTG